MNEVILNKAKSEKLNADVEEFLRKRGLDQPTQLRMGVTLLDTELLSKDELKKIQIERAQRNLELEREKKQLAEQQRIQYRLEQKQARLKKAQIEKEMRAKERAEKREQAIKQAVEKANQAKLEKLKLKSTQPKKRRIRSMKKELVLKTFKPKSKHNMLREIQAMLKHGAKSRGDKEYQSLCPIHGMTKFHITDTGIGLCQLCSCDRSERITKRNDERTYLSKKRNTLESKMMMYNHEKMSVALASNKTRFIGNCIIHGETEFYARKLKKDGSKYASCCLACRTAGNEQMLLKKSKFRKDYVHKKENFYKERISRYKEVFENAKKNGLDRTTFFCQHHGISIFRVYDDRMRCDVCRKSTSLANSIPTINSNTQHKRFKDNRKKALEAINNGQWIFTGSCPKHDQSERRIMKTYYNRTGLIKTECILCKNELNRVIYHRRVKVNFNTEACKFIRAMGEKYGISWRNQLLENTSITANQYKNYHSALNQVPDSIFDEIKKFCKENNYVI